MARYRFQFVRGHSRDLASLQEQLDELGEQGWRCVGITGGRRLVVLLARNPDAPPRAGETWDSADDAVLLAATAGAAADSDLARTLGRTEGAIRGRRRQLDKDGALSRAAPAVNAEADEGLQEEPDDTVASDGDSSDEVSDPPTLTVPDQPTAPKIWNLRAAKKELRRGRRLGSTE